MRGFEFFTHEESGVVVGLVMGQIDAAVADSFDGKMKPLLEKPDCRVVLDCRGLTYLSSRAIGLLVGYRQLAMQGKGRFVLCNLTDRLIELTTPIDLSRMVETYPSRAAAVAALT